MQPIPSNSDESLRGAVLAALESDLRTEGAGLRVGVLNGIVHLAGAVETLEARSAAAELAGRTPGVRGVVNRIEAPGGPSPARKINLDLNDEKNPF